MTADIHFIGLLRSPASWAKVGRELITALSMQGARVSAVSLKGHMYSEAFPIAQTVEAAVARTRVAGWDLALDYPPNFSRLNGRRRAAILIYEGDRFPRHWAEAARKHLDTAFVPSRFCLEAAAASGVPREMLAVAAFGANGDIYTPAASDDRRGDNAYLGGEKPVPGAASLTPAPLPEGEGTSGGQATGAVALPEGEGTATIGAHGCAPFRNGPNVAHELTGRAFNFLTVAAPHVRKGLKETAEAFCAAFARDEDVGLIIKCPPIAGLGRRPWEYRRVEDFLPEEHRGQVALVAETLSEEGMAALYRGADVYVQASYGEGFGLALAEAAACGKPVITTNWGAAAEVFNPASAWLVDYDLIDAWSIAYDWPPDGGAVRMARPRVEHLAALMRRAWQSPDERLAVAGAAAATACSLAWACTAQTIIECLEAV